MARSYECFCAGGVSNPPAWGNCRWKAEYGWDPTGFIVKGYAKTTCEAGYWFGVYAKDDRSLAPSGLMQVDCLKTPGGKPDWKFYHGCREGAWAAFKMSQKSFGINLPSSYTSVDTNFLRYKKKVKGFKRSKLFKNCCGTGDQNLCVDDLTPAERVESTARAEKFAADGKKKK